jgi:ABC-2 type transport system permease protein
MTKALRIAAREYIAYVRTVGFWFSICLMPLGLLTVFLLAGAAARATPTPKLAIVDFRGAAYGQALAKSVTAGARQVAIIAPAPAAYATPGAAAADAKAYLAGERLTARGDRLDAIAIVRGPDDKPALDLWTRNINEPALEGALAGALAGEAREARLAGAGLSPAAITKLEAVQPEVTQYSPKSQTGQVSLRDRLPTFVGFGMGIMLYSLVLTGAGVLLNSVIEEKQNRILEVMLTSASAPEIIAGKIIGAGAMTATALCVWAVLAGATFTLRNPAIASDIVDLMLGHGLIIYFLIYFVGGYLMYSALFATIGAFCETPREAQTLLGPLMILLTIPLVFMGLGVGRPDAPLLQGLSWFPPFTPFLMAVRAASGPPAWQLVGTACLMFATTVVELWLAGRAFRTGALSSGRFDIRLMLAGLAGRSEPAS